VLGVTMEELEEDLGAAVLARKKEVSILMEEVADTFIPEFVLSEDFALAWQEMELVIGGDDSGPSGASAGEGLQVRPASAPSVMSGSRGRGQQQQQQQQQQGQRLSRSISSRGGWLSVLAAALEDFPLAIQLVPGRPSGMAGARASNVTMPSWATPYSNARMRTLFGRLCDSSRGASIDYLDPGSDSSSITELMRALRDNNSCMVGAQCRFQDGAGPRAALVCIKFINATYTGPQGNNNSKEDSADKITYSLIGVVDLMSPLKDDEIVRIGNLVKALP